MGVEKVWVGGCGGGGETCAVWGAGEVQASISRFVGLHARGVSDCVVTVSEGCGQFSVGRHIWDETRSAA